MRKDPMLKLIQECLNSKNGLCQLIDEPEDGDLYWRLLMKSSLEQKDMVEMQWSQSTERVANFVAW